MELASRNDENKENDEEKTKEIMREKVSTDILFSILLFFLSKFI